MMLHLLHNNTVKNSNNKSHKKCNSNKNRDKSSNNKSHINGNNLLRFLQYILGIFQSRGAP